MTATIAADVKTIKEEILKLSSQVSVAPTTDPDTTCEIVEAVEIPTPPVVLTTEQYLVILRSAVKEILNKREKVINDQNSEKPSALPADLANVGVDEKKSIASLENDEAFKKSCGALTMYVRNVLDNPTLPRYRKITTTNSSFRTLVEPLTGYVEVFNAIGFRSSGTGASNFEWSWQSEAPQPDAKDAVVRSSGKPDEAAVKEILGECIRLFEICTLKGPLALIAELDNLSLKATAANLIEENAEVTDGSSATTQDAASSVESEETSSSLSKVQSDVPTELQSAKSSESKESQEVATVTPPPSLLFKDVSQHRTLLVLKEGRNFF